ncbi:hypothetical protein [Candidatus Kuenenia stuttgartiensis]|nr:hypothetical protein [Candidatus Kuenenia stuttgartiensis]
MTGADLENLANEAALIAVRKKKKPSTTKTSMTRETRYLWVLSGKK